MNHPVSSLRELWASLGLFLRQERSIFLVMLTYAIVVGVFSLIIPLTVQELVNTFAFSVSPVMVLTIVGIMAVILVFVGVFRVLQFYAMDILERRVFVHVALILAQRLPRYQKETFQSEAVSRFFETVFLQRALSSFFVDFINVLVGGVIGMVLLAIYHPYFAFFDVELLGAMILICLLGRGGLQTTLQMSGAKYDVFNWFQEVANNFLHFKTVNSSNLIMRNVDRLASTYVQARQSRFRVLVRQYIGSLTLQVILHAELLGIAGWLVSQGELTVGQLVAAEVVVASLLLNFDSVTKRAYIVFYFFAALAELRYLLSLPQDKFLDGSSLSMPESHEGGLHLTCSQMGWATDSESHARDVHFEALPGEKWALICPTPSTGHRLSLVLAGLLQPPSGAVRYNGVDLRSLSTDQINGQRSIVFEQNLTLFEGSIADNITMGRSGVQSEDLIWALRVAQLEEDLEALPDGLATVAKEGGRDFTPGQRLRILLARAIITRPSLLILDGDLHEIASHLRKPILHQLGSKDCPWTLVILTIDPFVKLYVEKSLDLCEMPLNV